ncbi:hypothetical protein [Haloechinothrix sp. LS1_15]|uniref:hypothetical protein n=1 Tax=Haloechinothrix sp. LS1_15 TaxID=2652248 RepID=UPI00294B5FD4|nr:hypothetical protein [Haloechinothrix sp. LS1_15]
MDATEFRRELDRRLEIIEDPEYTDPAREDMPGRELAWLAVASLVLIVVMFAWGYPW